MRKFYYICSYDDYLNQRNLSTQPSGVTKINYIRFALKEAGIKFDLLSIAECKTDRRCFNLPSKKKIDDYEEDSYILSIGRSNLLLKVLSRMLLYFQLICFLLFKVHRDDIILVYHVLHVERLIYIIRHIVKRNVYFEIEEIYHAVYQDSPSKILKEISLLQHANGYILVNDIMRHKCKLDGKAIVCYGAYVVSKEICTQRLNSEIHVVYAGLIAEKGTDVYLAIDSARYLPSNYHVHILGYGTEQNITCMLDYMRDQMNAQSCSVTYDGCLYGDEYDKFLANCQIGLCTRVLDDNLSDYTFPSKVLVYLGHNIVPVCSPLNCITESKIKDEVCFCENVSAQAVAQAILSVKMDQMHQSNVIQKLHNEFVKGVREMFT